MIPQDGLNILIIQDKEKDYLDKKKFHVRQWPPYSPDLNPIENLWAWLNKMCKGRDVNNETELFDALNNAWKTIDISYSSTKSHFYEK